MKKNQSLSSNSVISRVSPSSQGWLTAALDPYHDYQYEVDGLPDERCAPSVVQIHNQTLSITVPASAAGGNWDASILYTGFNTPINFNTGYFTSFGMVTVPNSNTHGFSTAGLSTGQQFGAVCVWTGAAGTGYSTGSPLVVGDGDFALGSVLTSDRCRLIGCALEVHNTTAEVYKQGSLTVGMLPDTANDTSLILYRDNSGAWSDTFVQADRALVRASSLTPLLAVPGSTTWSAADGVYAIPRMTMVPRDIYSYAYGATSALNGSGASTRVPIIYGTDGKTATPEPRGYSYTGPGLGIYQAQFAPSSPSGFSPLQVWFSGLSAQTTLTLKFRSIVEYFPALNSALLPLASPSPIFDPKVLALYSAVVAEAPYAVQVDQNAAGDYFRKILKVLGQSLELISPIFGSYAPLAMGAGGLMKKGASMIRTGEAGPNSAQKNRKGK
jgi:hypothetical protein